MSHTYTTQDKELQEEILSKDKSLKSWAEVAAAVRARIKRLEHAATAFERYRDMNEPFIGESFKNERKASRKGKGAN